MSCYRTNRFLASDVYRHVDVGSEAWNEAARRAVRRPAMDVGDVGGDGGSGGNEGVVVVVEGIC